MEDLNNPKYQLKDDNEELEEQIVKKDYITEVKVQVNNVSSLEHNYNEDKRLFGMKKLEQSIMNLSIQKRRFKKIWIKLKTTAGRTHEQVAFEVNKMFR